MDYLWIKEKDYGDVVLFFLWIVFKILSQRVDGTDRLKMAWLCGFFNVNIPGISCIFEIDTSFKLFDLLLSVLVLHLLKF